MTSDRRAIRAALIDVGIPIDRADRVAAELAAEADDDTSTRSWLGDALTAGRRRSQSPFRWGTPADDDPPPDAA